MKWQNFANEMRIWNYDETNNTFNNFGIAVPFRHTNSMSHLIKISFGIFWFMIEILCKGENDFKEFYSVEIKEDEANEGQTNLEG